LNHVFAFDNAPLNLGQKAMHEMSSWDVFNSIFRSTPNYPGSNI